MATVELIDLGGGAASSVEVADAVFGRDQNGPLLHEVVTRELAGMRQGTHATRTRGNVRGGGRKPWRQKGTGRARAGSNRSPLWRGGGTTFGPTPRDHSYRIPRKKVRLALKVALSDAVRDGRIVCVLEIAPESPKTKEFLAPLVALGDLTGALLVVDEVTENLALASRNVPYAAVLESADLTPYDVVAARRLVFSKAGLKQLEERNNGA